MTKTYKSELSAAIYETAELLHEHGVLDNATMREFDASCHLPKNLGNCGHSKEQAEQRDGLFEF